MNFETLHSILAKSLTIIAWPPFSLLCPLYASFRALESDCRSNNQRCLAFWVLFSFSMIIESHFPLLFNWLQWWPHVKGVITILLLIPYFGAAPYIYRLLVKYYCTRNIFAWTMNIFNLKITQFELGEDRKEHLELDADRKIFFESVDDSERVEISGQTIITNHLQEKKVLIYQGRDGLAGCENTKSGCTSEKKVQKEWSCALCQISTTSENCLRSHLQGKQHKTKEKELRVGLHATDIPFVISFNQERIKGMVLLRNFNKIANILNPVSRSIVWCEWKKPEFGWTKLNTDGSVNRETAGFGGLLRDYRGEPICAFVSKAPQGDTFLVELWAIWRGLVLSFGLGIKSIWVESDSASVVNTINRIQHCPKAGTCLKQIWKLLSKFDEYRISHSWRETNRAADHLAKMDLCGNDVVLWPVDFSDSLCNIIQEDARGTKYLRR
ncbi:unnamed protein product [Lathyrus sativus]|nr:unnamed protein product [Lathyrus sativus]